MKTLIILLSLVSLNSFAMNTYTHCEGIMLSKNHQAIKLTISKEGELLGNGKLNLVTSLVADYGRVEVEGLDAEIDKATLIDSTEKSHWGLAGPSTTFTKVYGVKFHVEASEPIATEIRGCIAHPVNELDAYAVCYQSLTIMDRE